MWRGPVRRPPLWFSSAPFVPHSPNVSARPFCRLTQKIERLRREHDIAILAPFALLDPNDLLCAVDMLDLQLDR
jgi:hypothetical protein